MDLTPYVYCNGEENVIAVHITNDGDVEGWWYEGAGIYRNVWLIKTNKIALDMWGIRVKPKKTSWRLLGSGDGFRYLQF